MARRTHITITVSGKGQFPLDMLRYDACWPSSGRDASAIADTFHNRNVAWSINVTRANTAPFTNDRWESFGVQVKPAD